MNAKKIMGAVLVALLAAALFVGAGAAGAGEGETVFFYQELDGYQGTWNYAGEGSYSFTLGATNAVISDTSLPEGKYELDDTHFVYLKKATGVVSAIKMDGTKEVASVIGGTVAEGSKVAFNVTVPASGLSNYGLIFIGPNGIATTEFAGVDFAKNADQDVTIGDDVDAGEWKVMAYFGPDATGFSKIYLPLTGTVYTFTIADSTQSITLSADTVISGNVFTAVIAGEIGDTVTLSFNKKVDIIKGQPGVDAAAKKVTIGKTGSTTVGIIAREDGDLTITAAFQSNGKEKKADLKVLKGTITATADEESFFIGNPIKISGTSTAGNALFFYIEGTNFPFVQISADKFEKGKEWTAEFDSNAIMSNKKLLIAGTYTLVASTFNATDAKLASPTEYDTPSEVKEAVMDAIYGTAAVTMTQPFITGIEANSVAIQGVDYDVTGTAYAADFVRIYIFGTNYFNAAVVDVDADDETFEFTLDKDESKEMAPGTYFYLIQHPMGDKIFNVWNETELEPVSWYYEDTHGAKYAAGNEPTGYDANQQLYYYNGANFYYAPTGQSLQGSALGTFIFNVYDRGTNYAAQALLEEISGQNIDDIFVQGTFEVAAQKLTINPIPAEVAKGTALTVSGTSNSGEGVEVIVNVLAGKFGATVKGDENSAIFLTAKAVTEDDGTFEAAIDTSKLPVGAYIVTVELGGQMYDSAAVSIVDKAPVTPPTDEPEQPVTPPADDKPTEPETPGFGALAALAGLGAVAVLLLRRE